MVGVIPMAKSKTLVKLGLKSIQIIEDNESCFTLIIKAFGVKWAVVHLDKDLVGMLEECLKNHHKQN